MDAPAAERVRLYVLHEDDAPFFPSKRHLFERV